MKIFTAIIPFYNEAKSIKYTLDQIKKTEVNNIICVDDGSTDQTSNIISANYPDIKIISLFKNHGKSKAIEESLQYVSTPWVLLFDADLSNIVPTEINFGLDKINSIKDIDLLIFRRKFVRSKIIRKLNHDIIMSGQRIIKTQDLKNTFASYSPNSYEIEMAINQYMIDNRKNIKYVPLSTHNPTKTMKWGLVKGMLDNFIALKRYFSLFGVQGYINQIRYFRRKVI